MPKARRRKGAVRKNTAGIQLEGRSEGQRRNASVTEGTATNKQTEHTVRAARRVEQTSSSYQTLIMPGMVTLGCLGLAISFSFFTNDPNRFLYGGIAALMALMWAYSFWLRLRKVLRKENQ